MWKGQESETGHHDGTEDPADSNRGDHPPPGQKRRKLLQQLQGQITLGGFQLRFVVTQMGLWGSTPSGSRAKFTPQKLLHSTEFLSNMEINKIAIKKRVTKIRPGILNHFD